MSTELWYVRTALVPMVEEQLFLTDDGTLADLFHLTGPGIDITYRRSDNKLDIAGEHPLAQDDLDADAVVDPLTGLCLTATLLVSSRNGTRIMLTVLLPEVNWNAPEGGEPTEVSGVAIVTRCFANVIGGPPPVLHDHDGVWQLQGTASPAH